MILWKPCLWSSNNFSFSPKIFFQKWVRISLMVMDGILLWVWRWSDQVKVLWHSALLRWLLEHPVVCPSFDHNKKLSVQLSVTSGNCWLHKKLLEFILILCCFGPGGSEYVWQRGVESVLGWVTGGRSWPYFQKKNQLKWAVAKNSPGHNFQNIASKLNQRGLIVYEPMLIQFGSDILKIVAVFVFFDGSF